MSPHPEKLVVLIETMDPVEGEVIKSKLEAFGIPCTVQNESAGHLFGIMLDGLARTRIYVPEDDLDLARQAIRPGEKDTPEEPE